MCAFPLAKFFYFTMAVRPKESNECKYKKTFFIYFRESKGNEMQNINSYKILTKI